MQLVNMEVQLICDNFLLLDIVVQETMTLGDNNY